MKHINTEIDQNTVPKFCVHNKYYVKGFYGKYSFLSNYYPLKKPIYYKGFSFYSVETAYQFSKFNDSNFIDPNMSATQSKKIAKLYKDKIRKEFVSNKNSIMFAFCFQKFSQDISFINKLKMTKDKHLEETNSWGDSYWGTYNDKGQNNLGEILMQIRQIL